jgi:hypothetical protein
MAKLQQGPVTPGCGIAPVNRPEAPIASTRENLMKKADVELDSVDTFYPEIFSGCSPKESKMRSQR